MTDITEEAIEALSRSRIKRVSLIGRRGPLQVAFTIKEFRELVKLEGTASHLHADDLVGIDTSSEFHFGILNAMSSGLLPESHKRHQ